MERNLADDWPPLRTLTDVALRHWNIAVTCKGCARARIFSGAAVWWLFNRRGWSDDVRDAADKFRCRSCGIKGLDNRPTLSKTRDAVTDDGLPLPDEREWKRLVSRYRS